MNSCFGNNGFRIKVAALHSYPRHLVLAAAVGGLLVGPYSQVGVVVLALGLGVVLIGRIELALLCCLVVFSAGLIAEARLRVLDTTELSTLLGDSVSLKVEVGEPFRSKADGGRAARVKIGSGRGKGETLLAAVAPEVWLPQVRVGEVLALRGRLRTFRPYESYHRVHNVHAVLEVASVHATGKHRGGLAGGVDRVREAAERVLTTGLGKEESALLKGMVLGQDAALSDSTREEFRRSGLAHLVAASGQNIMLLAALAFPVLALLGLGLQARFAVVLGLIALYVPLAGAGPSIQRAGIMGAAGIFAGFAGRPASRWYALLLSALVTLLINPRSSLDIGWQLSFAAVVAIFLIVPDLHRVLKQRGVPNILAEALAVTIAATLGTAPLSAFHFEQLSLVSLPANLLAAPAVAPIMWMGALTATLGQLFTPFAVLVGVAVKYPLAYVEWVAHTASLTPNATVVTKIGTPLTLIAVYTVIFGIALVLKTGLGSRVKSFTVGSPARLLASLLITTAVVIIVVIGGGIDRHRPPRLPTISFLDIGQGDATLIQDGSTAVLVDTGPPDGPILKRLAEAGVSRLDLLIVTHAQADHEGGAPAVLAKYPLDTLIDGAAGSPVRDHRRIVALATSKRVKRVLPTAGQVFTVGRIKLQLLWPDGSVDRTDQTVDPNDRAVVALLTIGDFDLLLTADAETNITGTLDLPPVEVLKVAHHGSDDPGLPDLLQRLGPTIAAIEVGRHNGYGHPTPATLAALEQTVPELYRTDRDGTVRVTVEEKGWSIKTGD